MISQDNIIEQFKKKGFNEEENHNMPSSLLWQPNFVLTNGSDKYYILLRSSNTILPTFLNRISKSSAKYNSIIVFGKKCTKKEENEILSLGISVGYFISGRLTLKLRNKIKALAKEASKKLQVIDIFISSKQDIQEREFVRDKVEVLRKINTFPFNPPHLIEYEKFNISELYEYIDSVLDDCDWIIIIIEDNPSDVVKYEIARAIKQIAHENIFMFVKSSKLCQSIWKEELDKIKNLKPPTIKYLPYNTISDLEVTMSRAIQVRMNQIYNKRKIKTIR